MAHHKRRRPKNRRAGCLLCKPHKACGAKHPEPVAVERQIQVGREERLMVSVPDFVERIASDPDGPGRNAARLASKGACVKGAG
jgi:hypothetical protein